MHPIGGWTIPELKTRRRPARLSFHDDEVVVTPKDSDIFFINAERAIEACRYAVRADERVSRFSDDLIVPLRKWCVANDGRLRACYIAPPDSAVLQIYVVGAGEAYDYGLTQRLSDLAFAFSETGWAVHASQIAACSDDELAAIFDPGSALKVYGD